MPAKDFAKLLLEAVDEGLSSFGMTSKQKCYSKLEESFNVEKEEIPYKVEAFVEGVEEIFGAEAVELEISILRSLYGKIGEFFEYDKSKEFVFKEYVKRARIRLYSAFVDGMQSGLAVFHLENVDDLKSLRLIALNSAAVKTTGIPAERALDKTLTEIFSEALMTDVQGILAESIRSERARDLGEFHYKGEEGSESSFWVATYPLFKDCLGLVFGKAARSQKREAAFDVPDQGSQDVDSGFWRWELDTVGRQVHGGQARSRGRWIRREFIHEPNRADFFMVRGKEYLEEGDPSRAREFINKAEELYQQANNREKAFESASLRISTYYMQEKPVFPEYFDKAEEYFSRYSYFSMHERFSENLAHYCRWKGYTYSEEHQFERARASYLQAEEMLLAMEQKEKAIFNASQCILTYASENKAKEYLKEAEAFFEKYVDFPQSECHKEVSAHYYSYKSEECEDPFEAMQLRSQAERLFLEIDRRELAFENASKYLDLYWHNSASSRDEMSIRKCVEATERFLEQYIDFSEHENYRKRSVEYYLYQARAFASQLRETLQRTQAD